MRPDRKTPMSAVLTLMSVSFPIGLAAAPLACSDDPMPQQQIQANCNKAAQLLMRKNPEGYSEIIAPSAVFIRNGKNTSYAEWKQDLKRQLASRENLRTSIRLEGCSVKGQNAVAHIVETDDFTVGSVKGHKFHTVGKITLTLIRNDKGWVSTRAAFDSHTLLRDGKKVALK